MAFSRFFIVVLFLVLTSTVANAYTLVMRNGRRVEIPNEFKITGSTLTYTVGSGIQITIQLSGVDIAATERANREARGSFLAKGSAPGQSVVPPAETQPRAQRSITNRDLEPYRRARIQSELAYEKRRKELALPSAKDRLKEVAAIEDRTREQLLGMRAQEQASEEYWRDRASSIRSEMSTTLAQIDYVRRRLDELPSPNSFSTFSTLSPFGNVNGPFLNFPFQNVLTPNLLGPSLRGNRRFNRQGRFNRFNGRGRFSNPFGGNVLAFPYDSYDYGFERAELTNQLHELEMNQAGLNARWRELEEQARRAGAYPGWLRP
jgi:hypothetical protein